MSLVPGVLIAMPVSSDPNLSRAVLLLIQHDARGSFGIVINQPSTVRVGELVRELGMSWRGSDSDVLWRGGPVAPQQCRVLYAITHAPASGDDVAITPSLAMARSAERLRALVDKPPRASRFVLGSVDWAQGQLAASVASGSAYADADPALVFETAPGELWERVQASGQPVASGLGSRLRRLFGASGSIPRATLRRK